MARRRPVAELLLDPGVLDRQPVLELHGATGAAAVGGVALLPWRRDWLEAERTGVAAVADPATLPKQPVHQAVVHLQKGWAATLWACAVAWQHLAPGGRLLLCGGNELGIKTAAGRLGRLLSQDGRIVANRARGRVVRFHHDGGPGPPLPEPGRFTVAGDLGQLELSAAVGLFSADGLDPGSRLLLEHLAVVGERRQILDLGCGTGVLGLVALGRLASSTAILADADHRAVCCARANADGLGLAARCQVVWWDAVTDPPPCECCDLVLVNPPFHRGTAVDLAPATAMVETIGRVLVKGGLALVVANRTLPYERPLQAIGHVDQLVERDGYKLLRLRR